VLGMRLPALSKGQGACSISRYDRAMIDPVDAVRGAASSLGFDRVTCAPADLPLDVDYERYRQFVARGMHGTMAWLARHAQVRRRLDDDGIVPGARSVICVAQRYAPAEDPGDGLLPRIARYARGLDYHDHFRKRLRKLAAVVRSLAPGVRARPIVDTAPVLERAWAARSGLGFIGKNGMLIIPDLGSYVVLGEIVTDLPMPAFPGQPLPIRCGRCTRCLDACPTGAFDAPRVLDPRRCIAYLTIEHEGPWDPRVAERVAPWVFGCDRCQEVCPYNHGSAATATRPSPFDPLPRWADVDLQDLLRLDAHEWDRLSRGTPLRRVSLADIQRNASWAALRSPADRCWTASLG
jgi:epoxyqueuosine reductase